MASPQSRDLFSDCLPAGPDRIMVASYVAAKRTYYGQFFGPRPSVGREKNHMLKIAGRPVIKEENCANHAAYYVYT